jgi:hypothetical protein
MAQTMKAFVMKKLGSVGMMEKPIPDPGPNDAIVKTTAALVCTSDVHTVGGAIGERTNLTLGHEAVGVIYKLGSAVKGFREGDRVGRQRHHSLLSVRELPARLHLSMYRDARRVEVRERERWKPCRIFPCQQRASEPGADSSRVSPMSRWLTART